VEGRRGSEDVGSRVESVAPLLPCCPAPLLPCKRVKLGFGAECKFQSSSILSNFKLLQSHLWTSALGLLLLPEAASHGVSRCQLHMDSTTYNIVLSATFDALDGLAVAMVGMVFALHP